MNGQLFFEQRKSFFAVVPPDIVFAAGQRMVHLTIKQHDAVSIQFQWKIFMTDPLAIQQQYMPLLSMQTGIHIHDAAFNARVIMLGTLAKQRQFGAAHSKTKQFIEGIGQSALHGRRGTHARAAGYIAAEHTIKTGYAFL